MNKPKVELKNVKTFRGMEGFGLNADIYINGVKCLLVIDEGCGGEFLYYENIEHKNPELVKANIELLDNYIATLPAKTYGSMTIEIDRDIFIDNILAEQENEKNRKKMVKLMETAILIGVPNTDRYSYFRQKLPLAKFPKSTLQSFINSIKDKHCKDGVVILNTNLQKLGIIV